jgi:hypothetical protein
MTYLKSYLLLLFIVCVIWGCDYITKDEDISKFGIPTSGYDEYNTYENKPVLLDFLTRDSINQTRKVTFIDPLHGTITAGPTVFIYLPDSGFVGTDSVHYTLCIKGNCRSTTLIVHVRSLTDTFPSDTITDSLGLGCTLEAVPDRYIFSVSDTLTNVDTLYSDSTHTFRLEVLNNDVICGPKAPVLAVTSQPLKGTARVYNNTLLYTANRTSIGKDSLRYSFCIEHQGQKRCREGVVAITIAN